MYVLFTMLAAMRWLMNFIVSVGLMCAGLYVLYEELFVRYSGIHGRYRPFGVGLALLGSGVVWLWFYCLGPFVLKKILECRPDRSPTGQGGKRRILIAVGKAPAQPGKRTSRRSPPN
jgi:hypothetical protein